MVECLRVFHHVGFFFAWWRGRNQQGSAFATGIMVQVFLLAHGIFRKECRMKGDDRLVKKLDELLSDELTAIMQYVVHAEMCATGATSGCTRPWKIAPGKRCITLRS